MSDSLTALASENLNPSLRSLLEDVLRGHIRVPRFQRPFVWSDSQRLDLLRSIRDNMPIGSLLVWRTAKFKLASFPTVGPHSIPPITEVAPATGWQYLLDGHQRVSTLLGLLLPSIKLDGMEIDDDSIDWNIQYDLMDQDFVFGTSMVRRGIKHPILPLWTLFDGRQVNKFMRELRREASNKGWTDDNFDLWEERADQLSYRFQQCRIPIVVMVTDELELAAKTFQRINSLGTPMNEAHLVAALTWRSDFDLRDRIADLKGMLPVGWKSIDESIYLQVCKGLAGLDMTKAGQNELVKKLTEDASLLERAGSGLKRASEFLVDNAAIVNLEVLPYAFQVVLLAVELDSYQSNDLPKNELLAWFWRTSWSEIFSTGAYRQIKIEQERLRNVLKGIVEEVPWGKPQSLPVRFDSRSARVRLVMIRLAMRSELVNIDGNSIDSRSLLLSYGRGSLLRLFPVPTGASHELRLLLQGGGNRFLIAPGNEFDFRERLLRGPDLSADVLNGHFIDSQSLDALRSGRHEEFFRRRADWINKWDEEQWASERRDHIEELTP